MKNIRILLTKREIEIFQLRGEGLTNKAISKELYLSIKTVEVHIANIVKKLGLESASDLTHYAVVNKDNIKPDIGGGGKIFYNKNLIISG